MKVQLLYQDGHSPAGARRSAAVEADLVQDLELDTLWDAMAGDDAFLREVARTVTLASLTTPRDIAFRQEILDDCIRRPVVVRAMYAVAVEALAEEKNIARGFLTESRESLRRRAIRVLDLFARLLARLRELADRQAGQFRSAGFTRLFEVLRRELDDAYLKVIADHLKQLQFRDGVLLSARLGDGNRGIDYVLRTPRPENRGGFFKSAQVKAPAYSLTVADRDDAGARAAAELCDQGLSLVAVSLAQAADHVLSFFAALRTELGFYIGCLNLRDALAARGETSCYPDARPLGSRTLTAQGLYDPCLSLRTGHRVVANDLDAGDRSVIIVTGANQGGKSTFLRSFGLAQLMMQCGMFVAATSFSSTVSLGIFTHYRREEDASMASGKFDEELARMSDIADSIGPDCLLLCNESFAATNEREGSQIATDVLRAMTDAGVTVVFVTHLFDLAHRFYNDHPDTTLFLRAERGDGGNRTFRIAVGEPRRTSFGADLYVRTFK